MLGALSASLAARTGTQLPCPTGQGSTSAPSDVEPPVRVPASPAVPCFSGGFMVLVPVASPVAPSLGFVCFADPHHHTVPQGDPQQRAERQLRGRKPHEGVALVAREAPEREAGVLMRLSRGRQPATTYNRGRLACHKLSEHPAEYGEMVNI